MNCNVFIVNTDVFVLSYHPIVLGKSALHWAAAVNNVEATLVLLKNGANRDMQDNKVCSCLLIYSVSNSSSSSFSLCANFYIQ